MKKNGIAMACTLVVLAALVGPALAQEFFPGQIIVKLKEGASTGVLAAVAAPGTLSSAPVWKSNGAMLVTLAEGVSVTSAVASLAKNSSVEYAEPDWI